VVLKPSELIQDEAIKKQQNKTKELGKVDTKQ
jgi:hypothetical protein